MDSNTSDISRKRGPNDMFDSDDDDDIFLAQTADDIVQLEDFLRSKEESRAPLLTKTTGTNVIEELSIQAPLDAGDPLFISNHRSSSTINSAVNINIEQDHLTYPESPPSQGLHDAMEVDLPLDSLERDKEASPLMQMFRRNIQGREHEYPTTLFPSAESSMPAESSRSGATGATGPMHTRHDFTKPPLTGSYVVANCPKSGCTLYLPKRVDEQPPIITKLTKTSSLIEKPIWKLLAEMQQDANAKVTHLERESEYKAKSRKNDTNGSAETEMHYLWVEKYKPRTFMDLLSDQRVNREVLRWVKQWDYCVFGKAPQRETQRDKILKKYKSTFGSTARFRDDLNDQEQASTNNSKDALLRPLKKIMLISGPPGFGKTTLAHVIANHTGYNVIEVNASDDRTGDVVKSKIKSALEMQAIIRETKMDDKSMTKTTKIHQKPNILIIDEIDGASSGGGGESFIKQLVQLATVEINKDEPTKRGGNTKNRAAPLLRPIICICNDAYAPVLRPLRAIALNIQFRKIPIINIAKRLQTICEYEGLETDLRTLSMLSDSTDGDIRSCLNTLQFVRESGKSISKQTLDEASVGRKDLGTSLFSVWEDLFITSMYRPGQAAAMDDSEKYFGRLLSRVLASGELERVMQGCFETFPHLRFHDVAMNKFVQMHEWLHFYDVLDHRVHDQHEYGLFGYLPIPILNFHRFFATVSLHEYKIEYPRTDYEVFLKKKSFENLVQVFLSGIHILRRRFLSRDMLCTEIVPRLLRIISPDLRPVNKQLIKPAEKAILSRLVDTMIEFGLTFVQEKDNDGQFVYKMEPPIEQLIHFEAHPSKSVLPNRYAVRQLIAQQIDTEVLRRRDESLAIQTDGNKPRTKMRVDEQLVKKVERLEKAPTDFFGRIIEKPQKVNDGQVAMEVDNLPVNISYRYHEGFSNAVKKPMTVQMFL